MLKGKLTDFKGDIADLQKLLDREPEWMGYNPDWCICGVDHVTIPVNLLLVLNLKIMTKTECNGKCSNGDTFDTDS